MKPLAWLPVGGLRWSGTVTAGLLAMLLGVLLVPRWAEAQLASAPSGAPAKDAETASSALARDPKQLALVVAGIISYTRWPTVPVPLRVCVIGYPALVEQLKAASAGAGQRNLEALAVPLDTDFKHDCAAVYVTAIPPDNARTLLRRTVGSPVLTMGEGAEFCSDGGMFCLDAAPGAPAVPASARPRFSANLDAIARSGLRVNPQVLLLARVPKAATP